MSTTVHYFGKVISQEAVREVQEDFRDIAQVSGWAHEMVDHVFTQEFESASTRLTLRGIRITLSKTSTPLQLTFDKDGYLSHIYYERSSAAAPLKGQAPSSRKLLHQVHTSTNLRPGDAAAHVTLVKLLDHLNKRYVPNLEVVDNTGYWFSRDPSVLAAKKLELAKK